MCRALTAEIAKLKRASLPWWTIVAVLVGPSLSNVFATAVEAEAARLSWSDFFGLGSMAMGTWYGILLFGLVAAFVFGREYAEGVAPNMLTVPTRREYFVLAKFIVLGVWVAVLTALSVVAQAAWATLLGLDGFAWSAVWAGVGDVFTVALLIFLTLPLVALVAVVSRGVFAPMIFSAFGFSAGMIGGIAGWGDWLPWAMPTAIGGTFMGPAVAIPVPELTTASWAIAASCFVIGTAAVMWWVNRADSRG